jgi:small subunit ribosomal protein S7
MEQKKRKQLKKKNSNMAKKFKQREIPPDPVYNNVMVSKFINQVMRKGKKTKAQKIVYGAFEIIKNQTKKDPLEIFEKALENVGPVVEVRPQRIGGATYQIPREVKGKRRQSLAMRWIIEAARNKKGKPMEEKLAQELILAAKNEGDAVRKRINVHRMAEANRAFAYLAR